MLFKDLKKILENKFVPKAFSLNKGFPKIQYGNMKEDKQINKIMICLDISINCIYYALKNKVNLIISHHPIFYDSISNLKNPLLNKLNLLSKYPISIYVLNKSFISSENGISETIAKILYLRIEKTFTIQEEYGKIPIGRICRPLSIPKNNNEFTLENLLKRIQKNLNKNQEKISYVGDPSKIINKICIVGGDTTNKKYLESAIEDYCDCYISSNLNHQHAVLAEDMGMSLINISHHNSEILALKKLTNFLSLEFPNDEFMIFESKDPFKFF